jgi:uncharacterized protein (TIGR00725 family)
MRKPVIGVMGPGAGATDVDLRNAFDLGRHIATKGWILLSGGRDEGVMDAVNRGAKSAGGFTVGVMPGADDDSTSAAVDISILTGMGSARNNINVLSSAVVVACGMGPGTASEVALALKAKKNVVLLCESETAHAFFKELDAKHVYISTNALETIEICTKILEAAKTKVG